MTTWDVLFCTYVLQIPTHLHLVYTQQKDKDWKRLAAGPSSKKKKERQEADKKRTTRRRQEDQNTYKEDNRRTRYGDRLVAAAKLHTKRSPGKRLWPTFFPHKRNPTLRLFFLPGL